MASTQENQKPRQTTMVVVQQAPIDVWNTREKLALATAIQQGGDRNWNSIVRQQKGIDVDDRPADWYSAKFCAQQYRVLLDEVEVPKRNTKNRKENAEKSSRADETAIDIIVTNLTAQRKSELDTIIHEKIAKFCELKTYLDRLKETKSDEKFLNEMRTYVRDAQKRKLDEAEQHEIWLKEREAKILKMTRTTKKSLTRAGQQIVPAAAAAAATVQPSPTGGNEETKPLAIVESDRGKTTIATTSTTTTSLKSSGSVAQQSPSNTANEITATPIVSQSKTETTILSSIKSSPKPIAADTTNDHKVSTKAELTAHSAIEEKSNKIDVQVMECEETAVSEPVPISTSLQIATTTATTKADVVDFAENAAEISGENVPKVDGGGATSKNDLASIEQENSNDTIEESFETAPETMQTGDEAAVEEDVVNTDDVMEVDELSKSPSKNVSDSVEAFNGDQQLQPAATSKLHSDKNKQLEEANETNDKTIKPQQTAPPQQTPQPSLQQQQPPLPNNREIKEEEENSISILESKDSTLDSTNEHEITGGVGESTPTEKSRRKRKPKISNPASSTSMQTRSTRSQSHIKADESMKSAETPVAVVKVESGSSGQKSFSKRRSNSADETNSVDANMISEESNDGKSVMMMTESPSIATATSTPTTTTPATTTTTTPTISTATSSRAASDDSDTKKWKQTASFIFRTMRQNRFATFFNKPAEEYANAVLQEMNLPIIRARIESGEIRNMMEMKRDFMLMLSNALMCSNSDDPIHNAAIEMGNETLNYINGYLNDKPNRRRRADSQTPETGVKVGRRKTRGSITVENKNSAKRKSSGH